MVSLNFFSHVGDLTCVTSPCFSNHGLFFNQIYSHVQGNMDAPVGIWFVLFSFSVQQNFLALRRVRGPIPPPKKKLKYRMQYFCLSLNIIAVVISCLKCLKKKKDVLSISCFINAINRYRSIVPDVYRWLNR